MKRRNFIKNASLTSVGLAVGTTIVSCKDTSSNETKMAIPSQEASLPLVIATWNVKNATAKAWEVLKAGGSAAGPATSAGDPYILRSVYFSWGVLSITGGAEKQ